MSRGPGSVINGLKEFGGREVEAGTKAIDFTKCRHILLTLRVSEREDKTQGVFIASFHNPDDFHVNCSMQILSAAVKMLRQSLTEAKFGWHSGANPVFILDHRRVKKKPMQRDLVNLRGTYK